LLKKNKQITGANKLPFDQKYWKEIYGDGHDVDGTFNAREHAAYIKSLFRLMDINVHSLGDFGFGKGKLLKAFAEALDPDRIIAIDPSEEMVGGLLKASWIKNYEIAISHSSLEKIRLRYLEKEPLDLLILNSVLQYVSTPGPVMDRLAKIARYVYFSVPTAGDYKRMKKELGFEDPYAFKRSKGFYRKIISPGFRHVSWNLLESRFFQESFEDELFIF